MKETRLTLKSMVMIMRAYLHVHRCAKRGVDLNKKDAAAHLRRARDYIDDALAYIDGYKTTTPQEEFGAGLELLLINSQMTLETATGQEMPLDP
jgi:hypothetical protein